MADLSSKMATWKQTSDLKRESHPAECQPAKSSHITGSSLHSPEPALMNTLHVSKTLQIHRSRDQPVRSCEVISMNFSDMTYVIIDLVSSSKHGFWSPSLSRSGTSQNLEIVNSRKQNMKPHVWTPGLSWCYLLSVWEGKAFLYTYSNIYLHMRQLVIVQEGEKNWYMV